MGMPEGKRKTEGVFDVNIDFDQGEVRGDIKIHEGVVATIVRRTACSVDGVVRIAGSTLVDNIAEIVGSKKMQDRSINIFMHDGSVSVELAINIAFGVHLPTVAAAVQSAVGKEIRRITGLAVKKVNVVIREMDELKEDGI